MSAICRYSYQIKKRLLQPGIFFCIHPIDLQTIYFFNSLLNKCIIPDRHGTRKIVPLPLPVIAILEVFSISADFKGIAAPACYKYSRRIFTLMQVMRQKGKMSIIDDLDKGCVLALIS